MKIARWRRRTRRRGRRAFTWLIRPPSLGRGRRLALAGCTDVRDSRGAVEAVLGALDVHRGVRIIRDARAGLDAAAGGEL